MDKNEIYKALKMIESNCLNKKKKIDGKAFYKSVKVLMGLIRPEEPKMQKLKYPPL